MTKAAIRAVRMTFGKAGKWGTTLRSANGNTDKSENDQAGKAPASSSGLPSSEKKPRAGQRDMGVALRQVYQRTIEEKIPDDLLDLLGKLG